MSKMTELQADLRRVGFQLGGAHLTQQARRATFNTFAKTMGELEFGIRAAKQIGARHLQAFVVHRTAQGINTRTLANELSHLRTALAHEGKHGFLASPACTNQALGLGRGSRVGMKAPLSDAAFNTFRDEMSRLGRSGISETLELQRTLGLRETEAICSGQADTLARWQRELEERGCVHVVEGTKGGRPRDVRVPDLSRAQAAVRCAQEILNATGRRFLVTQASGETSKGLRQAVGIYRNLCHRAGIQSHSARYAFAQERLQAYRDQGYSEREARAATSQDLGHGDGRGRYIASVYARDT